MCMSVLSYTSHCILQTHMLYSEEIFGVKKFTKELQCCVWGACGPNVHFKLHTALYYSEYNTQMGMYIPL